MPPRSRRGYHHGNLREELIRVTRDIIAERSPQGFLISDAAKAAGVSPAAPYRHFKSKEDLIAAIALEAFPRIGEKLQSAFRAETDPFDGLMALSRAYLDFAKTHQGEYMAMFESGLNVAGDAELSRAAMHAFEPIQQAAAAVMHNIPENMRPPVSMVAQHILAMAHGTAELFGRGEGNLSAFAPKDLLESQLRIYLKGLGVN